MIAIARLLEELRCRVRELDPADRELALNAVFELLEELA